MSLFKCAKCGCAENTALGWYHLRKDLGKIADFSKVGEQYRGEALCSECAPTHFKDGTPTGFFGRWHGRFPKKPYDT